MQVKLILMLCLLFAQLSYAVEIKLDSGNINKEELNVLSHSFKSKEVINLVDLKNEIKIYRSNIINQPRIEGLDCINCFVTNKQGSIVAGFLSKIDDVDFKYLSSLKSLRFLKVIEGSIKNIEFVEKIDSLEYLYIDKAGVAGEISIKAKKLKHLIIKRSKVDVVDLQSVGELIYLDLSQNSIKKINGIDKLKKIKTLRLDFNDIENLNAMSGLVCLEYLNIYGNPVKNVSFLKGLVNLEYLGFDYYHQAGDFSIFEGYKNIKYLTINLKAKIKNLFVFPEMPSLAELNLVSESGVELHSKYLQSMSGLERFKNIVVIDLSNNNIRKIESIESLKKLKVLNVNNNPIKSWKGLAKAPESLEEIHVMKNVGPLQKIPELEALREKGVFVW